MAGGDFLLVAAMDAERQPFLQADPHASPSQPGPAPSSSVTNVNIGGARGQILVSGIGPVNAASALSGWLAKNQQPRWIVSVGSAGGLHPKVKVGDVIVGTHYRYADVDARQFGYAYGQVPGMPEEFQPTPAPVDLGQRIHAGLLVTSASFVDAPKADTIRAHFPHAWAVDMESAALAHTCHIYGVQRFVAIRGVSDLCSPQAGEEFHDGLGQAAERSREITTTFLSHLAS